MRLQILGDSGVKLFNANGQTALETLRAGAYGYCGIMCNFHPKLYAWLCHHFKDQPETADRIGALLSMCAFTENPVYPVTAKYHMNKFENIPMSLYARSAHRADLTHYQKTWVEQMRLLTQEAEKSLGL